MDLCPEIDGKKIVDLGSGDGRVVIRLARNGAKAEGIEINPILILISKFVSKIRGVSKNTKFYWQSFWDFDLSSYDGVIIYGISYIMPRLEGKLKKELKKNSFVISQAYKLPTWKITKESGRIFVYQR